MPTNFSNIVVEAAEQKNHICTTIEDINKLDKKRVQYRNNSIVLKIALLILTTIVLIILIISHNELIRNISGVVYICILVPAVYLLTNNKYTITSLTNTIKACSDSIKLRDPTYTEPVFDNISLFTYLFTKVGQKYNTVAVSK